MKSVLTVLAFLVFAGLGHKAEAGVTNRKTIIAGKLVRSGAAGKALDDVALKGLCEEGFTLAIFTYKGASDRTVSCSKGSIRYTTMTNWKNPGSIVNRISSEAASGGKTLVHCWHGVHASNAITSAALVKMCNFSGEKAADWFVNSVPKSSLSEAAIKKSTIDQILANLRDMRPDGTRVSGCP